MHFGRRHTHVKDTRALTPETTEPTLKHAMESLDLLIQEARANRDKVRKVVKELESLSKQG